MTSSQQASGSIGLEDILSQRLDAQRDIVNVDEPEIKLVVFSLGHQQYAFMGQYVQEVLVDTPVHFVPGCPEFLQGVINVRGDIASVIAIHDKLHTTKTKAADKKNSTDTILLCKGGGVESGIYVDHMLDVLDIPASQMQAPPANVTEDLRPLITGVVHWKEQPITVIDVLGLLASYAKSLGADAAVQGGAP